MISSRFIAVLLSILVSTIVSHAETWDEPWQKEILQKADYFILAEVIDDNEDWVKLKLIKNFGDKTLPDELLIDDFFMLNMTSSSGHGVHFRFQKGQKFYFFLKKNANGNYSLPTPTSGFANLNAENNVVATYRHSYHQALVTQDAFEFTYKNIWSYFKKGKYDVDSINRFVQQQLSQPPAGFEEDQVALFFLQHVALETAYLLGIKPSFALIEKFALSDNFHSRISALQLLGNLNTKESKELLLSTMKNELFGNFEQVIAIWALKRINDTSYIKKLKGMSDQASDEMIGFGGNIMDPRVGTRFPSPKEAIEAL